MVQSNPLPGTLYVVATPIGNLEDITLRALRVLREVKLIAAEDTRRTAKLLAHYAIRTPTTSLHEHNERQKAPALLERILGGDDVALVSDAGTPLLSDPGNQLVLLARGAGVQVVAVPGASALLTALAASGHGSEGFVFLAFPPRRLKDLYSWLAEHFKPPHSPTVFFEAPHRIRNTLSAMLKILGDRPILIGRELTKIHEELVEQPISVLLSRFEHPRGEFTVVVPATAATVGVAPHGDAASVLSRAQTELGELVENEGLRPRSAAKRLAQKYGLSANELYRAHQRRTG